MRKKFLAIFFVGIASMLASVSAQVVQRDGGATPFRTVTPDENGVTVSYNLDGLRYEEDDLYPGSYRKVKTPEESSATLSLKSLDGYYSATKEVGDNSNAEFDVTGLNKGIYTVTLSVDGRNIETTKTILK